MEMETINKDSSLALTLETICRVLAVTNTAGKLVSLDQRSGDKLVEDIPECDQCSGWSVEQGCSENGERQLTLVRWIRSGEEGLKPHYFDTVGIVKSVTMG